MSSATARDGVAKIPAPTSVENLGGMTAQFVPDEMSQHEFSVRIEHDGASSKIPLSFKNLSFKNLGGTLPYRMFVGKLAVAGGSGESVSIRTSKDKPMLQAKTVFTQKGSTLDDSVVVPVTADPVTVYEHTPGPYSTLTTEAITRGITEVNVGKRDGSEMLMKSIPLPPKSGAFFMSAMESSVGGEPPIVAPGTLAKRLNPLNKGQFLLAVEDYDAVLAAYSEARQRDLGAGLMDGLVIDVTRGEPGSFTLSGVLLEPASSVQFEIQDVAAPTDDVL